MHPFSRRLDDNDLIEHFLTKVLEFYPENMDEVILKIKDGEFQIKHYLEEDCTLGSTKHRDRDFKDNGIRWKFKKRNYQGAFRI